MSKKLYLVLMAILALFLVGCASVSSPADQTTEEEQPAQQEDPRRVVQRQCLLRTWRPRSEGAGDPGAEVQDRLRQTRACA